MALTNEEESRLVAVIDLLRNIAGQFMGASPKLDSYATGQIAAYEALLMWFTQREINRLEAENIYGEELQPAVVPDGNKVQRKRSRNSKRIISIVRTRQTRGLPRPRNGGNAKGSGD